MPEPIPEPSLELVQVYCYYNAIQNVPESALIAMPNISSLHLLVQFRGPPLYQTHRVLDHSIARSLGRSLSRLVDRSVNRSLGRSFSRSQTLPGNMCVIKDY